MNGMIQNLAKQKWFVPGILFLLLLIAIPSITDIGTESPDHSETSTERQLEELCNTVRGVSNAKVMITYEAKPTASLMGYGDSQESILGIAVVCDGGSDSNVQLALYELLETLFQLSSTRITISERN